MRSLRTALAAVAVCVGAAILLSLPYADLLAQSRKKFGDVRSVAQESWMSRVGFAPYNSAGLSSVADVCIQRNEANVAAVEDCSDAQNLAAVRAGALYLGGPAAGTASAGAANSDALLIKTKTGIADATATPIATVTVPNANHQAVIPITLMASLGAGGAVGAGECTATAYGQIVVTRTAGKNAVATAVALSNTGSACVAGATTITLAYAVSSISGAVGAVNTFTINVTITKGAGSSANHYATVQLDLLNAQANGITVS